MLQNEDEKYLHIREKLRNLPKVKASDNFMVSLQHKINLVDAEHNLSSTIHKETHERINQGAFARFFGFRERPWLIPSLSFTVVIFLVLMVVYFGYFNTPGTDNTQTSNGNSQTITQNSGGTGNTYNNNSSNNQQSGTNNNSGSTEQKIGNTDSQPGKDEGLLATNDDKLGKTDSYNNKRINTMTKPEVETSRMVSNISNETVTAEPPAKTESSDIKTTIDGINNETLTTGTVKDESGKIKSAMKPFDEKSGVSVDDKKKQTSKNPRNIREVNSIGKTDLEEIMNALTGE